MLVAMVMGPNLPMNMTAIRRNLEAVCRCGVIPVESPTVAKAETLSKATCKKV